MKKIDEEVDGMGKSSAGMDLTLRLGLPEENNVNVRSNPIGLMRNSRGNPIGPVRVPRTAPMAAPYQLPNFTALNCPDQMNVAPCNSGLMRDKSLEAGAPFFPQRTGERNIGGRPRESHLFPRPNPAGHGGGLANFPATSTISSPSPPPSSAGYNYNYQNPSYARFPASPAAPMNGNNGFPMSTARKYLEEVMVDSSGAPPGNSIANNNTSYMYNGRNSSMPRRGLGSNAPVQNPIKRCSNYNCNTTDTPMWRRGPFGPKTLCNACGIKYRKEEEKQKVKTARALGNSRAGRWSLSHF
ncbi:hypothetical protein CRG98_023483 [Punica granatum]|uniref:GATA-type domain-containing protein n=2 Tax=Punica granatum TaxID=22663 RepID=A0A2I0JIN9_PUNGR|nr:hypothetical protein CRG98_023483 [Punica granatum]